MNMNCFLKNSLGAGGCLRKNNGFRVLSSGSISRNCLSFKKRN